MMALMHLAQIPDRAACSAREISETYRIPAELMAKILQRLTKKRILVSQHGISGGYSLASPAGTISAASVIEALEGPLSMTNCVSGESYCTQFDRCNVKTPLQRLHEGVIQMLGQLTIEQMVQQWPIELRLPFPVEKPQSRGPAQPIRKVEPEPALPVLQDV